MQERLFPNGTITCPDCKSTLVLEAKNYETPEDMVADVPEQLAHHEGRCHVKLTKLHEEHGARVAENAKLQAKLKADALQRRAKPAMSHTPDQVQEMLRQATEHALAARQAPAQVSE